MAKSLTYKKTTTKKVSIKGTLSEDAKFIKLSDDKEEKIVAVQDYLDKFASMFIEFSIGSKCEENLTDDE